jgi:aerobic carbon-monoxide dehydrogenase medium subunit
VIPAPLRYQRATSVHEAIDFLATALADGEEAKLLAGGHSLLPVMKLRLAAPEVLVDITPLTDLRYVRLDGDTVRIGALTRHHDLHHDPVLREHAPVLAHVAGTIGDPQVRHRGTIGGSLAHADSAADLPAAVLASDAVLTVQGPSGTRDIPAADFFQGPFTTPLDEDELVTEIQVPARPGIPWGYQKFTRRQADWAIVGVAAVGHAVALVNMGGTPLRATATEQALASGATPAEAALLAADNTNPPEEPHATADYRRHLARVLTARALSTT